MLKSMKESWHELKEGRPGSRFRDYYDDRKENRSSRGGKIASIAGGLVLVIVGIAIGWLPGPGGFVAIIGLALLAKEIRPIAAAMDWSERVLTKCWDKIRGSKHHSPAEQPAVSHEQ